ncbi:hypothetical protein [Paenibacillus xylaniclasticus]|uniref:hypothetical protein n=1 Tax=Paenibacillus xylaniclasticus TaxID=588083 RepID=UPI000FDC6609|nr:MULTISPECIES: hypothetical protein [Paenibacillus]GFN32588.1 hypothetical protein PCURB6_28480 [Paenibacillus curdlanolyticus]
MTKTKDEYVKENFKKWKEVYRFPAEYDFYIESLLDLQWSFKNIPNDHVKTKKELLDMIMRIQNNFPLNAIRREI